MKPSNNVYSFLLIVAFTFMLGGVVFNMMELNEHYGVTFGGLMSPPAGKGPAPAPAK
ncbi:MAG: hypothetical protein HUU15_16330 [Candidatus Brocadiae bacterium]|nr:hypothetical protein [Candidatus Brocadiia bacterium]